VRVGDLVRHANTELECSELGIVVDIISKKVWRTHLLGKRIEWDKVDPEPHAIVMYPDRMTNGPLFTIPAVDLVIVNEDR
tara:strand:+ start:72 stop:311 length:240 start_codon:yes stop_codon:yes gene_type:complete